MANIYVRSTDGSDADSGATWALAKAKLSGASAIDAAGDTIYVSQVHSETTAASFSLDFAQAAGSITRILCGNDTAEPPTTLASSAIVAVTGNNQLITITGRCYVYGIEFRIGTGANTNSALSVTGGGASFTFENCTFYIVTTHTGASLAWAVYDARLINPVFRYSNASQTTYFNGYCKIYGGSFHASSTSPTSGVFNYGQGIGSVLEVRGFDFSNLSTSINLTGNLSSFNAKFIGCKLPSGWSGLLVANTPDINGRIAIYNCYDGAINYALWIETAFGAIRHETTLVRSGGANDGITSLSWKMTTNTAANFLQCLDADEIVTWNSITGTALTVTIEILHDSATALKDDEVWLEVDYLSSASIPLITRISDSKSNVLATGVNQTTSTETWTTTGMSNPNKQKLSVTLTPQMKGFIHAVVKVAKASYTVYVDPKLILS